MSIAWSSLGLILVIGLIVGAGLVTIFAVGVTGLSRIADERVDRRRRPATVALVALCFAICAAGLGYGAYLLVPQFH